MKISASKARLGTAALLLASVAIPAIGQDAPESLLPPGFDQPNQPQPAPTPAPGSAVPAPAPAPAATPEPGVLPVEEPNPTPSPTATPISDAERYAQLQKYELPASARRSLSRTGAAGPGTTDGLKPDAFGNATGRYLETLMRRLDTPIASRWVDIALRRALMSYVNTPADVNGADFAAERAWLLLRMGEANAARGVVQSVDVTDYTPKMFQVAMQVALATGDPAALCPLVQPASEVSNEPGWEFARAMCAALSGDPGTAGHLLDVAGRRRGRGNVDVLLAEKVVGAGAQGRRSVTIEWNSVDSLTAWRYGLAVATGVAFPDDLFATASPQVRSWFAVSPTPTPEARIPAAEFAATRGVFSNAGLVDLYGEVETEGEASSPLVATARDLRTAYTAATPEERLAAIDRIWDGAKDATTRYARSILTARAAARITPNVTLADKAGPLVASMLSAGLDRSAMRWKGAAEQGSDGWAMLLIADPSPNEPVGTRDISAFRRDVSPFKAQMLFAALAGLGRFDDDVAGKLARDLDVQVGAENAWTRAIETAADRNEPATVLLLAGVGMQTANWQGVPPEALFHIVSAMRRVGLVGEARMIAVEAIARL